tara:strand:+ start:9377 stop:10411 length:1035 start_codon:yes stop_codon:yes gene_type:complete
MQINSYEEAISYLKTNKHNWVITGVAGFIGSNLMEKLLGLNQVVIGVDNFSTGYQKNIEDVLSNFDDSIKENFTFHRIDITDADSLEDIFDGADFVLHQAALGSVPRSVADPLSTHDSNINGFLNALIASRNIGIKRFVYASSSSIYGDHPDLPKVESKTGNPLSPYAVTKLVNEIYAKNFSTTYGFDSIGLRYFNIFGKRQDPEGAYAAVIPKWLASMINEEQIYINGDGKTTRDFCYIENVIQANIMSALTENESALNKTYNIAVDGNTSLLKLYEMISQNLNKELPGIKILPPIHRDFQDGDVRHSQGSIDEAKKYLCYSPTHTIDEGLLDVLPWYIQRSQ